MSRSNDRGEPPGVNMSEGETPARYKPNHLGRYKVRDAGAGNRNWLAARVGNPALTAIGAEEGDYIVLSRSVDMETGEETLTVKLDKQ